MGSFSAIKSGSALIQRCRRRWEYSNKGWDSIFGGENDVHRNKGERLRHIEMTLYLYVVVMLDLAPLQGASPRVVGSRG